ncbi:histidinol dehydrogenase [Alkalispirochaeta americana]|uniref:Histidinol dehydrogenase n=1 Tax=Alkalispirochaeta americana TaxID=159291 RepID=A0A1N6NCJ3_9SPIO|nr:histidinol dehydrogenase [Alkalispirochaeta americana]SIP89798.1 histidinol dehydrogenase [Alkalispirochaeta americana]
MSTTKIEPKRWDALSDPERARIMARSQIDIESLVAQARPIVQAVEQEGDAALIRYARELDQADISSRGIAVSPAEFDQAEADLPRTLREAIDFSIENIRRFHQAQVERAMITVEVRPGIIASERSTPIEKVGLYVPSGRGSFPSMLYMLAVPAVLAEVPLLAVTTPPRPDGSVDPAVLYAARRCGLERVYRAGGAQAVAALAYGTETVPAVHKIVGPGSAWVAAAKRIVADRVDVGVPAGPSESIVLADESARAWKVSLDLMIEAEHGSDSSALLVTPSERLAREVADQVSSLIDQVPEPRKTFLRDVFTGYGGIIVAADEDQAVEIVNDFAPEHLLITCEDSRALASRITNASEILIGEHSAFSLANYAAGPNAVLPTGGWARTFGPVSVRDFRKSSSLIEITPRGYQTMKDHVITLADSEGFYTHAMALRRRDEDTASS